MKDLVNIAKSNWLYNTPSNWDILRVKNLFKISKEKNNGEDLPILSLTQKGIKVRDISDNEGQIAATYENYTRIRENDIVFNPMDLRSGAVDLSFFNGVISLAYTTIREKNKNSLFLKYYKYFFQWHYLHEIYFPFGQGVSVDHRWTLKDDILLNFPILVPPIKIQESIANFLDDKTRIIDDLIEKKEKMIKLLHEKRLSLITNVITRGVNQGSKMKPSGIDWLGDILEECEVFKLRHLGKFTASGIDKTINESENSVRIINYTDVYRANKFILKNKEYMVVTATSEKIKNHQVNIGDLIFTPSSEVIEEIGLSALVDAELKNTAFSYHVLRFQFNDRIKVNHNFKKYLANNFFTLRQFSSRATGSIRKTLGRNDFKEVEVLLPKIQTQEKMAAFLDAQIAADDDVIALIKNQINQLKEYRSSLIYSAVTGKIKV